MQALFVHFIQSPPSPHPPDPPDPDDPFPPLGSSSPKPNRFSLQTARSNRPVAKLPVPKTVAVSALGASASKPTVSSSSVNLRSGNTVPLNHENFKILPPKSSSPIQTNKASGAFPNTSAPSLFPSTAPSLNPNPKTVPVTTIPPSPSPSQSDPPPPASSTPPLVQRIRQKEDKSLKRLAPVSLSDKGIPRVLIPDSVFQKGAEIHKDFIICYFNGRPPAFTHIQSVLNHMWGKGKRVEIHTNPLSRSMLVRIPSDYLRQKILEKSVWYVGESMFHAVQWSSSAASQAPPLESIQIWAHLTGVPLDLRHTQGLSLVAGLVGDPKETDEFTLNLVSLTLSHVKVAVDLTKPLPNVVEFMRENGEVVEVQVSYPWVPPTCSHCKELGHVSRNCLLLPPPSKTDLPAKKSAKSAPQSTAKDKQKINPEATAKDKQKIPSSSSPSPSSHPQPKLPKSSVLSLSPLAPSSSKHLLATPVLKPPIADPILNPIGSPLSPPDSFYAPSLKRPRPDPNPQLFPSFLAQLSFFSASSSSPALTLPPSDPAPALTLSNPYSVLVPDGSLRHEETID
ncbi:uncharacterized protein LOC108837510 [Raphanus sativus]|uniref:Uncharacterized protein LOC108837510 n=1 Tax=Raphanus sativus TaxID=3726 RepID=A0A9W3CST4_RAPSA|nr:uncharacterized protein LOC108837510 [Raphanus sativus]